MLVIPPAKSRAKRVKPKLPASAPFGPQLVNGSVYIGETCFVTMAFDRDVDVVSIQGSQFLVKLPAEVSAQFHGSTNIERPDAQSIRMELVDAGELTGDYNTLTASGTTGIVASDDGIAWAGVTDFELSVE